MGSYAVVAVDDVRSRPDQPHHYHIPAQLHAMSRPGCMVIVPFGRRLRRGWLLELAEQSPVAETKPIVDMLTDAPSVSERQIALARWLSRRAHVSIAKALGPALPEALLSRSLPRISLGKTPLCANDERHQPAQRLLARLARGPLRLDRAWSLLSAGTGELLTALERAGVLRRLPPPATGVAASKRASAPPAALPLDRSMQQMCSVIFADLTNHRGSVFLTTCSEWPLAAIEQLIHHASSAGKQALVLAPHPARAGSGIAHLTARFPSSVVLRGQAGLGAVAAQHPLLTVGGRWAPFAPLPDLGLVVVLDEHDPAYAGERAPHVHGREVALQAARLAGATTVLVSPTPDPATLWRGQRAGIKRFALGSVAPVHVELVDMRQELRAGRGSLLSAAARRALSHTLAVHGQALLMLNRRGSALVLTCRRCGVPLGCPHCTTSLACHADEGIVRCHCCNFSAPRPPLCPRCKTPTLEELGAGVQRLANELQAAFPNARLARWDRDAAANSVADAALTRQFSSGGLDLLVGTQLVALAEELVPVPLAVAAAADVGLHLPDYRAAERSYEILSALRRRVAPGGRLILQSYAPSHWVLQALATDAPALFYREELRRRQERGFPPFRQLARLTYRARSRQSCEDEAIRLRDALAQRVAELLPGERDVLLGPAPAHVELVRGVYRWQIHLRAGNVQPLLAVVPPHWTVEVDPEGLW